MASIYLVIAILAEVIATTALKASNGLSQLWPSVIVVVGYSVAFYCLSVVLKTMPLGIVYAIWSGIGVVLLALIGFYVYKQTPDVAAIIGMVLIISGVVVIRVFSSSVTA